MSFSVACRSVVGETFAGVGAGGGAWEGSEAGVGDGATPGGAVCDGASCAACTGESAIAIANAHFRICCVKDCPPR